MGPVVQYVSTVYTAPCGRFLPSVVLTLHDPGPNTLGPVLTTTFTLGTKVETEIALLGERRRRIRLDGDRVSAGGTCEELPEVSTLYKGFAETQMIEAEVHSSGDKSRTD